MNIRIQAKEIVERAEYEAKRLGFNIAIGVTNNGVGIYFDSDVEAVAVFMRNTFARRLASFYVSDFADNAAERPLFKASSLKDSSATKRTVNKNGDFGFRAFIYPAFSANVVAY